jgi:hypothetical protein
MMTLDDGATVRSRTRRTGFAAGVVALGLGLIQPGAPAAGSAAADDLTPARRPHRLIVLTDIEADPDDTQSLVRLLLYSDVVEIQGLIATTSIHRKASPAPDSIRAVIRAYSQVHGNLLKHSAAYPAAGELETLVKEGQPGYGMAGVGAGRDSEGSNWIIRALDSEDPRPLWVAVWGGPNTLAQALRELRATRTPAALDRLLGKLRVYTISDQDDSGAWIRKEFPSLFYIVSPGGYGAGTWTGIHQVVSGIDNTTISNRWLAENIQQGHGPLGAAYPDVAYGMEGDTPSWLALVPTGLGDPEHPEWGGWGGRYELYRPELSALDPQGFTGGVPVEAETRAIWTNAVDEYAPPVAGEHGRAARRGDAIFRDFKTTLWRWRDDFQNDFAARVDWTVKPYAEANHAPAPVLDQPAEIRVRSGQVFTLGARATDPDGDSLSFLWFQYPEAGSCKAPVQFHGAENLARVTLAAPTVGKEGTVHLVLRVTDKGTPPLSRYARVIVTVVP